MTTPINNNNNNNTKVDPITDDSWSQIGIFGLSSAKGTEHGPYRATLSVPGSLEMELITNGKDFWSIVVCEGHVPFEELESYRRLRGHIQWEGDFTFGWLDFEDVGEFYRVALEIWGSLGCQPIR